MNKDTTLKSTLIGLTAARDANRRDDRIGSR